ncbi:MAG: prealbumin-like fold domain-containing protein, partial [Eggerthellaceae bacterium]|nr:prealbumin-like fold domain-containing protein [Eggerthellaceae bacterium]
MDMSEVYIRKRRRRCIEAGILSAFILLVVCICAGIWLSPSNGNAEDDNQEKSHSETAGDATIEIAYDDDAQIPDGTEIEVQEYSLISDEYENLYSKAQQYYGWDDDHRSEARFFNLSLLYNDETVNPESDVTLTVTFDDEDSMAINEVALYSDLINDFYADNSDTSSETSSAFVVSSLSDLMIAGFEPAQGIPSEDADDAESDEAVVETLSAEPSEEYQVDTYAGGTIADSGTTSNGGTWSIGAYTGNAYQPNDLIWTAHPANGFLFLNGTSLNFSSPSTDENGQQYITSGGNRFNIIYEDVPANPDAWTLTSSMRHDAGSVTYDGLLAYDKARLTSTNIHPILVNVSDLRNSSNYQNWMNNTDGYGAFTLTDAGTLTIPNALTVDGKSVDLQISIDEVTLYGSFAAYITQDYNPARFFEDTTSGTTQYYYCIGYIINNQLWIGGNYTLQVGNGNTIGYTYNTLATYPCNQDVTLGIKMVYDNDATNQAAGIAGQTADRPFLQVGADIDIYKYGTPGDSTYQRYGSFAEAFFTISGLSNDFYVYDTEQAYVWSSSTKGVTEIQANQNLEDVSGNAEYSQAGIYSVSNTGSWQVQYTGSWCATMVEIYGIDAPEITVNKTNSLGTGIANAQFRIEKVENGQTYYFTGYDSNNDMTWGAWAAAQTLTTSATGSLVLNNQYPGSYTLIETKTANTSTAAVIVPFELTYYGALLTTATNATANSTS